VFYHEVPSFYLYIDYNLRDEGAITTNQLIGYGDGYPLKIGNKSPHGNMLGNNSYDLVIN
jgi:hypothetical protein